MSPRTDIKRLIDIPNVGKATLHDFNQIAIRSPQQLIAQDPYALFDRLCKVTGHNHDPCMIDVFIAAVNYMNGEAPQKWWFYTQQRKAHMAKNNSPS